MTRYVQTINGVLRGVDLAADIDIYDEELTVVSGTPGADEINPITAGNPVTLPNSGTYQGVELEIHLNGQKMEDGMDYAYVGSGTRTQITFTFDLEVGDLINFRKVRDL